ncbi:putative E3 ubiquitin-protein ligase, partial [Podila epigama]
DLAKGFDQLLNYEEDDVEDVFCLNFVGSYEAYGESVEVPLISNGENIPVTNHNKHQYVERYANFIMNSSISDQFESFRRGFYLVCGGHALSLFRPEEIEFLVRGSAEPLDIDQLRSVTVYEGFNDGHEVIKNFWAIFKEFDDKNQRRLLQFITASDRYPATGIANLSFKITCMGSHDSQRMFTFCQYPFLISMGAKMQIMAWDAKRQMEIKMQKTIEALVMQKRQKALESSGGDALGVTLLTQAELQQAPLLILKVRRNNLIEESLTQLSRNEMDLKKSLRIEFIGEDGVDAGGLRKEWFLLLVRQLFDPQFGMFVYDDQSSYCWFNPASFESLDQFYLVGVVIGLAIYNSTILDLPLPLAVYKKLLNTPVTLEDLATFRP